jgi:hypothetical protein
MLYKMQHFVHNRLVGPDTGQPLAGEPLPVEKCCKTYNISALKAR